MSAKVRQRTYSLANFFNFYAIPAPNSSIAAIKSSARSAYRVTSQNESQLTETREHPVRREERRGLSDSVGKRGVKKHGGEVWYAVLCC